MRSARDAVVATLVAGVLALTACTAPAADTGSTAEDLTIGSIDLAAAGCPADIRIATDGFPQAEQGHLFQLIGDGYTIETGSEYSVTGPLMASGEYTGVEVTVISGGAARWQPMQPDAMMYDDDRIFMGYVGSDEAVVHSGDFPTVGVFAPLEKDPQMIMWDPEVLTTVSSILDLGSASTQIRVAPESISIDYLVNAGILSESQLDPNANGSFSPFVRAGGTIAQQGIASADPYVYENEIGEWLKPVAFQLIHDAGYPNYPDVVSVLPETIDEYEECLAALVPVLQQAELDFYENPARANSLIVEAVDTFDTFWVYTPGLAEYSVATQLELGIVGNGTVGAVDVDRVQKIVDLMYDIYADDEDEDLAPGLTAQDIVTDRFIDPSLGF